ncbi:MAG TPA: hypothetical protein PLE45_06785 [Spirochaetota bacterium]|nr:hypothetical protein [Spirochaetota bacterium]
MNITFFIIWFIISPLIFLGIMFFSSFLKAKKLDGYKNNAKRILSKGEENFSIINNVLNGQMFIEYLKSILNSSPDKNVIIELSALKNNLVIDNEIIYLRFDNDYNKIEILRNPNNANILPETFSFSDVDKIILGFKSFSERSGSGRSSTTYNYNQYTVSIKFKNRMNDLFVYNKTLLVSDDKGPAEAESRCIGELLAKIFKVNLIRIGGEEVPYDKLDQSITEKLKDFAGLNYSFKKIPFTVEDRGDNFCINQLKYYNIPKMVIGIIILTILTFGSEFLLFRYTTFNTINKEIKPETGQVEIVLISILIFILFILLLIFWIKQSKYKIPALKPLIIIYKDRILSKLVYKNNQLVSYNEFDLSKIEEIDVRYESSLGYSVKLVSDEKSERIASFYNANKSNYLKDEILSIIKRLNEN